MSKFELPAANHALWRRRMYEIIFEADTPAGKLFDVVLLILIAFSVICVALESHYDNPPPAGDEEAAARFASNQRIFFVLEWIITILFTIEYVARIICVPKPSRYIFSFFGIIDLLAILPSYISVILGAGASFAVIRSIRILRVFRVLKLVWLLGEANELSTAIWQARGKVVVFLVVVVIAVTISGAVMHELEPAEFKSIPDSMYWAIVTMTTVGYGDMTPKTGPGKFCASILIMLGYSLIIVPTGFVSAEFVRIRSQKPITTRLCSECMTEGHDRDATYCKYCGQRLR